MLGEDEQSSSSKKDKTHRKKRGIEGSPGQSSKRKKVKVKSKVPPTEDPCVAKDREEIPDIPVTSTSKGSTSRS